PDEANDARAPRPGVALESRGRVAADVNADGVAAVVFLDDHRSRRRTPVVDGVGDGLKACLTGSGLRPLRPFVFACAHGYAPDRLRTGFGPLPAAPFLTPCAGAPASLVIEGDVVGRPELGPVIEGDEGLRRRGRDE